MENQGSNTNNNKAGQKRPKARKSTGGLAPRKTLGPKARKYFCDKQENRVSEIGTQTFPSTSTQQTQVEPSTKAGSTQTDFNSRFYVERSDRLARYALQKEEERKKKCNCCQCTDSDSDSD